MRPFWRKGGLRNTCCVGLTVSIVSYTGTRYIIIMTLLLSSYSMVHSFLRWSMLINPFNRHWLKLFLKEYSLWESTFKSKRLWGENNAKLFTSIITTIVQYSMKHTSRSSKCEFKSVLFYFYIVLSVPFLLKENLFRRRISFPFILQVIKISSPIKEMLGVKKQHSSSSSSFYSA